MASNPHDGSESRTGLEDDDEYFPPLTSAADVNPGNYPRARFDDGLAFAIKEEARRRAPDKESEFSHQVGVAGEFGYSGYAREPINRSVYDDYQGDNGHDVKINIGGSEYRVEVKCVCTGSTELRVDKQRALCADYFVLCRTSNPLEMVEIIGCVDREQLLRRGEKYPGEDILRVAPELLETFEPVFIPPDRIRDAQVNNI